MSHHVGVWIDHKKALIVTLVGDKEQLKQINSNVEKHTRAAGGSRSRAANGPQDVVAEDKTERRFMHHLNTFYRQVIEQLHDADSILILGPGEAKLEFQKQIESKELRSRIVGVETSDKLTERQLVARVREHFHPKPIG